MRPPAQGYNHQKLKRRTSSRSRIKYRTHANTKHATCKKFSKPSSTRRGPKDGWNGLTLKILRYIVEHGVVTSRELAKAFNISRRAVLYHLHKLMRWGFVVRVGKTRDPSTIYKFVYWGGGLAKRSLYGADGDEKDSSGASDSLMEYSSLLLATVRRLSSLSAGEVGIRGVFRVWFLLAYARERGLALSSREIAFRLGYSVRYVERCLKVLVDCGLAVRLGGRRCRFAKYIACVLDRPVVHEHKHVRVHRYRYRDPNAYSPNLRDKVLI